MMPLPFIQVRASVLFLKKPDEIGLITVIPNDSILMAPCYIRDTSIIGSSRGSTKLIAFHHTRKQNMCLLDNNNNIRVE